MMMMRWGWMEGRWDENRYAVLVAGDVTAFMYVIMWGGERG
jgi:hypothetical protein